MAKGKVKPSYGSNEQNNAFEMDSRSQNRKQKDDITRSDYVDEYGEPLKYDPNFKGPLANRSCTDVICCILLLAFIVGWGVVGFFAFTWGNPLRILYPTDSEKRICGVKTSNYDMTDREHLLFFDMTKCINVASVSLGCPTPQVCVKDCPSKYYWYTAPAIGIPDTYDYKDMPEFCKRDVQNQELTISSTSELKNYVDHDDCPSYTIPMKSMMGRCMPSIIVDTVNDIEGCVSEECSAYNATAQKSNGVIPDLDDTLAESKFLEAIVKLKQVGEKVFADLQRVWWLILIGLCFTMLLAFIWIFLMRLVAGFMVWLSIFLSLIMALGGSMFCWYRWYQMNYVKKGKDFALTLDVSSYLAMTKTWLAFAIIGSTILLILFLVLVFLRKRIRIAIALIEESSKALTHMPSALFFPIFPFVLHLIVIVCWAVMSVYIASVGEPFCQYLQKNASVTLPNNATNGDRCDCRLVTKNESCYFGGYGGKDYILRLQFYNLFGFFWTMFFISGLADLTMAGAFASYYWAYRKPKDIPMFPVLSSLKRALRYHLGSVAFGSLILAIVKMIRVTLEYAEKKLKRFDNPVAKGFLTCLKCCFWCLEKFLKFLTKNAYIMIAIYGKNFFSSAKEAFSLIMRNVVRVWVLDKVTDFLLFIGKFVIVAGMGVASFYVFGGDLKIDLLHNYTVNLNYYFIPMILIIFGSYMICSAFFGIYAMAVDTTFLCFLEDCERNDGSPQKPYFMSKKLMKILGKKNKFEKVQ